MISYCMIYNIILYIYQYICTYIYICILYILYVHIHIYIYICTYYVSLVHDLLPLPNFQRTAALHTLHTLHAAGAAEAVALWEALQGQHRRWRSQRLPWEMEGFLWGNGGYAILILIEICDINININVVSSVSYIYNIN